MLLLVVESEERAQQPKYNFLTCVSVYEYENNFEKLLEVTELDFGLSLGLTSANER